MEQSRIIDTLETYQGPEPTRARLGAQAHLGELCLIRLQRTYNFLLFHSIILYVLDV